MYQYKITLQKSKISEEEVNFRCSQDVAENSFIHSLFTENDNDKEKLYVIILNIKNKVIGYSLISMGSLTASIVHPREVLKTVKFKTVNPGWPFLLYYKSLAGLIYLISYKDNLEEPAFM